LTEVFAADHIRVTPALAESCITENSSTCVESVLTICLRCLMKLHDITETTVGSVPNQS